MKQEKKNIAIIYGGSRDGGGIDTYLRSLFAGYDKKKLSLTLVSLGDWRLTKEFEEKKYKVVRLTGKRVSRILVQDLINTFKVKKIDLIVSQGMVTNFYGRVSAFLTKTPCLVVIHSDYNFDYPDEAKRLLYKVTDKVLEKATSKYIFVSKYLKEISPLVQQDKGTVIYNGIKASGIAKREKPGKKIVIGAVGRLHYTKGFHNLIEAISLLKEKNLELKIWGRGKEEDGLSDLIKKLGLEKKVKLVGYEKDKRKIFSKIDLYVQSSISEGFGLTVVEAMLAGKPVIVTPAGSLPEIIADGKTGIVANGTGPEAIASAISLLLNDKELGKKLAKKAREEAKAKYSRDKWLRATEKALLETAK